MITDPGHARPYQRATKCHPALRATPQSPAATAEAVLTMACRGATLTACIDAG